MGKASARSSVPKRRGSGNTEPLVYTVQEAAKLLRLGRGTAYQRVREGSIPSLRMGRRIVVPRSALEDLLRNA